MTSNTITTPSISVIIAVYNHFNWLKLILDAFRIQTAKDFEVIIADDGSDEDTVAQINSYIAAHPDISVTHSWQPDEGWRKNKCLNKAVRLAKAEYLVFVDGDCIPHPRFIEDHLKLRKRGRVFGGRRIDMSAPVSEMVESWNELPENYFRKVRGAILRNAPSTPLSATLRQLRHSFRFPFVGGKPLGLSHVGLWGCNMGMYKTDLESINGFDERYIDPGTGEDTDLEVRVKNAGMECAKSSRYALMLHRHHRSFDFSSPNNARILKEAREKKITRVEKGLIQ